MNRMKALIEINLTYYVEAKPPGFEQTSFLGLLSLELKGSQGRNLAGYMVVENDLTNLGNLQFYEINVCLDFVNINLKNISNTITVS